MKALSPSLSLRADSEPQEPMAPEFRPFQNMPSILLMFLGL